MTVELLAPKAASRLAEAVERIRTRRVNLPEHACAGFDCATCEPSLDMEELDALAEDINDRERKAEAGQKIIRDALLPVAFGTEMGIGLQRCGTCQWSVDACDAGRNGIKKCKGRNARRALSEAERVTTEGGNG